MSVATAQQVVDAGLTKRGQPYDQSSFRLNPDAWGTDCSGLMVCAHKLAARRNGFGDVDPGGDVSVTLYDTGIQASWDDSLLWTPAVMRFMPANPDNGWGNDGHVGMTIGDGAHMLESYGGGGVSVTPAFMEGWDDVCARFNDIDYVGGAASAATSKPRLSDGDDMLLEVVHTDDGQQYVFGVGTDKSLWVQNRKRWPHWGALGGVLSGQPKAIAVGNTVSVYVRGTDFSVWVRSMDAAGNWTPWENTGGTIIHVDTPY